MFVHEFPPKSIEICTLDPRDFHFRFVQWKSYKIRSVLYTGFPTAETRIDTRRHDDYKNRGLAGTSLFISHP